MLVGALILVADAAPLLAEDAGATASPPAEVATLLVKPPVVAPKNPYSEASTSRLSPVAAGALQRVYVPNVLSSDVDVIDPATLQVIDHFRVPGSPQHIVPSWDLKTLWIASSGRRHKRGSLTPIDPMTGMPGTAIPVSDAYNMYFTTDGKSAIVVAEGMKRLEFRDPHTMLLKSTLAVPRCPGLNHADFSVDGHYAIFTCEFGGSLVKIDLAEPKVVGYLYHLDAMSDPYWYSFPNDQAYRDKVGPRDLVHCWATDTDDATVEPRWGVVGKQKIVDVPWHLSPTCPTCRTCTTSRRRPSTT
jgi:YVTN family beta-propeller protein